MGKDYTPYELKPEDPKSASYAIRIQGDSMEPAFHDGGIAFVNHDALDNGDIGVFCVDGGTVIKQYYHDPLGMTGRPRQPRANLTIKKRPARQRRAHDPIFIPSNHDEARNGGRAYPMTQCSTPSIV